jgi:hypothetical protein
MRMQHWLHQTRCSRGGATTAFIFISFSYASPVPECVETDPPGTRCNPPGGGIRAARRSATACEARQIEPVLRCDLVQKELASCICGNARRDTTAYRQIWMIEKYAYRKFLTFIKLVTPVGRVSEHERRNGERHNADHAHYGHPSGIFQERYPVRNKVSGHLDFV